MGGLNRVTVFMREHCNDVSFFLGRLDHRDNASGTRGNVRRLRIAKEDGWSLASLDRPRRRPPQAAKESLNDLGVVLTLSENEHKLAPRLRRGRARHYLGIPPRLPENHS